LQDHAVKIDPIFVEEPGQHAGLRSAVGLAKEKFRGVPSIEYRKVALYEPLDTVGASSTPQKAPSVFGAIAAEYPVPTGLIKTRSDARADRWRGLGFAEWRSVTTEEKAMDSAARLTKAEERVGTRSFG
jgi:hypothetical protein